MLQKSYPICQIENDRERSLKQENEFFTNVQYFLRRILIFSKVKCSCINIIQEHQIAYNLLPSQTTKAIISKNVVTQTIKIFNHLHGKSKRNAK